VATIRVKAAAIGIGGTFSVLHDFFGHNFSPGSLSLKKQMVRLGSPRIDLNLIRVGSDQFTSDDIRELDIAVDGTRDTFDQVGLAIGRVWHWNITTAEADGYENIGDDCEAVDLADDWSVDNTALDVFIVRTYAGKTIGLSAVEGPCDKDDSKDMEGSVVAIEGSSTTTPFVLGHEIGHYLGLEHQIANNANLMFPSVPNGGNLTANQGVNMRAHCLVKPGV